MSAKNKQLPWWKEWWRFFRPLLLIYIVVVVMAFFFQRSLLYHPEKGPLPAPADVQLGAMQSVNVTTADGLDLEAWFVPPKSADLPVVAVFHGNGGSIANRSHIANVMMEQGYGVFLSEYRGFSGNPGSPTEEGLYQDGRGALKWLKEKGYGPEKLVLYGESLGSGVVVQLASEIQPKYLILQSPFNSAVEVALKAYPMLPARLLMKDRYDNKSKIGSVKSELLIVHGNKDNLIPIAFAQDLFAAANDPKTFITIEGSGHNVMYRMGAGEKIMDWLNARAKKAKDAINIFHPENGAVGTPAENDMPDMKAVRVASTDGLDLLAWFIPPKSEKKEVVVFFHGNAGNIMQGATVAKDFSAQGYGVLLCEYRGYSGNPGTPSEEGFYKDGRGCIKWLQDKGYGTNRMIFYGWSLGSGVVLTLAGETPPVRLVLLSTFTRVYDVFRKFYPEMSDAAFKAALKDTFDNTGKIDKVTSPVLFVHGGKDAVIPMSLPRNLFDATPEPKTFKVLPGAAHNDLFELGVNDVVLEWLEKQSKKQ